MKFSKENEIKRIKNKENLKTCITEKDILRENNKRKRE